jgi:nickel/cobalt transporter (NiCoT) family protein
VEDQNSTLQHVTGIVGVAVSGTFLLVIGLINLGVLRGILGVWRGMRAGTYDEAVLEEHLNKRGFLNRVLGRVTRAVGKPWHMYPVGLLFGLGFDTTTEVGLMVLAGGTAAFALPWYAVLTLPVLFAAGMSLLDTIDGSFMNFAYGWAFSQPVRKVYYNLTVTGLSVAVALIIGSIELIGVAHDQLGFVNPVTDWISNLDLNNVGFVIVAAFVVVWAAAIAYWKIARVEHRWQAADADSA